MLRSVTMLVRSESRRVICNSYVSGSTFVCSLINLACFRCVILNRIWQLAAACETAEHWDGAFGSGTDHDVSEQNLAWKCCLGEVTQRKKALSCWILKYLSNTIDTNSCCNSSVTRLKNHSMSWMFHVRLWVKDEAQPFSYSGIV